MTIHFEVVTPEKVVYKDDVDEILVPTVNGQIGILPNHAALLTRVTDGEMIIKKSGKQQEYAVTGGFLEVANNKVTLLADYAIQAADINVAKAEEAKKRAERLMQEKTSEKDFAEAEATFRRALLELKVAEKRKRRPPPPGS